MKSLFLFISSSVPADIEDEVMGVIHFSEEFRNRYGNCVPMFYQGSLEDALKESVQLPAKNVGIWNVERCVIVSIMLLYTQMDCIYNALATWFNCCSWELHNLFIYTYTNVPCKLIFYGIVLEHFQEVDGSCIILYIFKII